MLYADEWMDTHARESMRLADEAEEWVLGQPGGKREWYLAFRYAQGGFLFQERQFNEDEWEWLWRSRQERLRAYVEEDVLGFMLRTRALVHWSRALYYTGRGAEARRLLLDWRERHGDAIRSAEFMEWLMRVTLFEKGDWAEAGRVLEQANRLKDVWAKKPSEQRSYEALSAMYYDNIQLTEYGLLRARGIEKRTPVRRRDSLARMGVGKY